MKSMTFWLALVLGSAACAQTTQDTAGSPAPAPATGSEAALPLPAPSPALPPATSVDKNCAEAIGATPDTPASSKSTPNSAAGGPPISQEAKRTGCMIELPEKGKTDQKPSQPPE
jgi:hypothetical protein